MKAIAYVQASDYAVDLARAFARGCWRHGVYCEVSSLAHFKRPEACSVVWMYNLGATERIYDAYAGKAVRVVGDLGYWREEAWKWPVEHRPVRISVNEEQPHAHLNMRARRPERFEALGLQVQPVTIRGYYVLLCGHSQEQATRWGLRYGEWEANTAETLRKVCSLDIMVREKPNSVPLDIPHTRRCEMDLSGSIRGAWAVVCRGGNLGADAILHGVPVHAEIGPGAIYAPWPLDMIAMAQPMASGQRMHALADLAYWQWSQEEIRDGALWAHLKNEGML